MKIGDGVLSGQSIPAMNDLISSKMSVSLNRLKHIGEGKALIGGAISNEGLASGFYLREWGLFANDPNLGEILFCYGNAGAAADYIPPAGSGTFEQQLNAISIIGTTANVTAEIASGIYVTHGELDDAVAESKAYTDTAVEAIQLTAENVSIADTGNHFTATNVEGALAELFQNVSNGKMSVAAAITAMGQVANGAETFAQLAAKIQAISSDATAGVGDVLAGKTFYSSGKKTGTMPNYAGSNLNTSADHGVTAVRVHPTWGVGGQIEAKIRSGLTPLKGYFDEATRVTIDVLGLRPENVRQGTRIGDALDTSVGFTGTLIPASGNAQPGDVLAGKSFTNASGAGVGTIPSRGQAEGYGNGYRPATQVGQPDAGNAYFRTPAGYYPVDTWVYAYNANFTPQNIRSGTSIFGLTGTLVEGKPFATGTAERGDMLPFWPYTGASVNQYSVTVSGLSFTPAYIVVTTNNGSGVAHITLYMNGVNIFGTSNPGTIMLMTTGNGDMAFQMGSSAYASAGGFRLPVGWAGSGFNYRWYAWGA